MGQEISYCFQCQTRLAGPDFEKGRAVHMGDKTACLACAKEIVSDEELKALQKETSEKAKSSTSTAIRAVSTRRRAPAPVETYEEEEPEKSKAHLFIG